MAISSSSHSSSSVYQRTCYIVEKLIEEEKHLKNLNVEGLLEIIEKSKEGFSKEVNLVKQLEKLGKIMPKMSSKTSAFFLKWIFYKEDESRISDDSLVVLFNSIDPPYLKKVLIKDGERTFKSMQKKRVSKAQKHVHEDTEQWASRYNDLTQSLACDLKECERVLEQKKKQLRDVDGFCTKIERSENESSERMQAVKDLISLYENQEDEELFNTPPRISSRDIRLFKLFLFQTQKTFDLFVNGKREEIAAFKQNLKNKLEKDIAKLKATSILIGSLFSKKSSLRPEEMISNYYSKCFSQGHEVYYVAHEVQRLSHEILDKDGFQREIANYSKDSNELVSFSKSIKKNFNDIVNHEAILRSIIPENSKKMIWKSEEYLELFRMKAKVSNLSLGVLYWLKKVEKKLHKDIIHQLDVGEINAAIDVINSTSSLMPQNSLEILTCRSKQEPSMGLHQLVAWQLKDVEKDGVLICETESLPSSFRE